MNINDSPLVSVIMSVYNGEKYLKEAIESIINQTYKNLEFIIINDGSTDNSYKIIESYKKKDNRIILEDNICNKGLIYSLNRGIELSSGKYIARMDADDISILERLEKQVDFLEKNKNIAVLGTGIEVFKNKFKFLRKKLFFLKEPNELKIEVLFDCPIAHPTVMFRKEILDESKLKYDEENKGMEDFGLWLNLSKDYKLANLPEILLKYRFLSTSISSKNIKNINITKNVNKNMFFNAFSLLYFPDISEEEAEIHTEICGVTNYWKISKPLIKEKEKWIEKIYFKNKEFKYFDEKILIKKLHEVYLKNMLIFSNYEEYSKNKLFQKIKINKIRFYNEKNKIYIKRILKTLLR